MQANSPVTAGQLVQTLETSSFESTLLLNKVNCPLSVNAIESLFINISIKTY